MNANRHNGQTIATVTVGSRLFGTDTETSDYDYINSWILKAYEKDLTKRVK